MGIDLNVTGHVHSRGMQCAILDNFLLSKVTKLVLLLREKYVNKKYGVKPILQRMQTVAVKSGDV